MPFPWRNKTEDSIYGIMIGESLEVYKYHQVVLMVFFSGLTKIVMNEEGPKRKRKILWKGGKVLKIERSTNMAFLRRTNEQRKKNMGQRGGKDEFNRFFGRRESKTSTFQAMNKT